MVSIDDNFIFYDPKSQSELVNNREDLPSFSVGKYGIEYYTVITFEMI